MKEYTILLVEDDELDIISVKRTLKKIDAPHILHVAYNGKEALAMLEDEVNPVLPDVILLDLNMPKMNGIEFLKIIRSSERFGNLNVFIMTTSGENTDRKITEELGVSGYVIKPMSYTGNLNRSDSMEAFVLFHLRKILSGSH